MTKDKTLPELFHELSAGAIDESGIYPQQLAYKEADGKVAVYSLAVPPGEILDKVWSVLETGIEELIFGLDMTTLPGQGTEFADVLIIAYYKNKFGSDPVDPENWKIGALNYQHEPRIVRTTDWNNNHWDKVMRDLLVESANKFASI